MYCPLDVLGFFSQYFSFPVCIVGTILFSTFTWALDVKCSKLIHVWFKYTYTENSAFKKASVKLTL